MSADTCSEPQCQGIRHRITSTNHNIATINN